MLGKFEPESKCASNSFFWDHRYRTIKLVGDQLAYVKAQTDSFDVDFLCRLQEPKQFEKLGLIFWFYANPIVYHWDLNETIYSFIFHQFADNFDFPTSRSEFQGIALKV